MISFLDTEEMITLRDIRSWGRGNPSIEAVTTQPEIVLQWGGDYWLFLLEMRLAFLQLNSILFRRK